MSPADQRAGDSAPRPVNAADLRVRISRLRQWSRGDSRAPHKPLLLLLALGRVQRGLPRLAPFVDLEGDLRTLLGLYGPTRRSHHAGYPFWRLPNDFLWEVDAPPDLPRRRSNTDPPLHALRRTQGGFQQAVEDLLRAEPGLVVELAYQILDEHFEPSLHADILGSVGIVERRVAVTYSRTAVPRNPAFRVAVLRAYAFQCALCGMSLRLDGNPVGLEAAHVKWHSHAGPDILPNGLCLCPNHHKSFDLGLFSLDDDRRVVLSPRVRSDDGIDSLLGRHVGRAVRTPSNPSDQVGVAFAAWHRAEVFRGVPRVARGP